MMTRHYCVHNLLLAHIYYSVSMCCKIKDDITLPHIQRVKTIKSDDFHCSIEYMMCSAARRDLDIADMKIY